jgi:formate hydrogenlyase subunit 6/NADH:ubiquinone oxidoreductase subunit I
MEEWVMPDIDLERCSRCGLCVENCPTEAVAMTNEGPVFTDVRRCTYCGACETECPENAISLRYIIVWGHSQAPGEPTLGGIT